MNVSTIGLPSRMENEYANEDDNSSESGRPWIQVGTSSTLALLCNLVTNNQNDADTLDPEAPTEQTDEDSDYTSDFEDDAEMIVGNSRDDEALTVQVMGNVDLAFRDQDLWQELRLKRVQVRQKQEEIFAKQRQCRAALVVIHQSNASLDDMLANLHEAINSHRDELRPLEDE